jgi:hypothetical protein
MRMVSGNSKVQVERESLVCCLVDSGVTQTRSLKTKIKIQALSIVDHSTRGWGLVPWISL